MADSTVHVAIQTASSRAHCVLVQRTALNITILLAVFSSRNFNGCYNSHIVLSFVYLVVLCLNLWLGAANDCCFVLMMYLSSKLLWRKDVPHLQNTNYTSDNIVFHDLGKGWKKRKSYLVRWQDSSKKNIWPGTWKWMMVVQKLWNKEVLLWIVHGLDMCWGRKKVIVHRKSFVPKQAEHCWGDEMSQRKMLHWCRNWRINLKS